MRPTFTLEKDQVVSPLQPESQWTIRRTTHDELTGKKKKKKIRRFFVLWISRRLDKPSVEHHCPPGANVPLARLQTWHLASVLARHGTIKMPHRGQSSKWSLNIGSCKIRDSLNTFYRWPIHHRWLNLLRLSVLDGIWTTPSETCQLFFPHITESIEVIWRGKIWLKVRISWK